MFWASLWGTEVPDLPPKEVCGTRVNAQKGNDEVHGQLCVNFSTSAQHQSGQGQPPLASLPIPPSKDKIGHLRKC